MLPNNPVSSGFLGAILQKINDGKMDINRLKKFVDALEDLPQHIKDLDRGVFNMEKKELDSPDCHTFLISVVAEKIPELKEMYSEHPHIYSSIGWIHAITCYLMNTKKIYRSLTLWAHKNPDLWDNPFGIFMFHDATAFGKAYPNDNLTNNEIIVHWRLVLNNSIKAAKNDKN